MPAGRPDQRRAAAFFDVDGTLVQTTIVHYYVYFRRKRMSHLWGRLWYGAYLLKCVYYLALDRIDRSRLNIAFYRSYAGLQADEIKGQAADCYRDVIRPRRFVEAAACVNEHRQAGRHIVLVSGSLDFLIEPLAAECGQASVVAASLVESDGRFTGHLKSAPLGDEEKARRVREFAVANEIDLSQSYAYGDSITDLPMLLTVGNPNAVNPDRALAAVAKARDWPLHRWTIEGPRGGNGR